MIDTDGIRQNDGGYLLKRSAAKNKMGLYRSKGHLYMVTRDVNGAYVKGGHEATRDCYVLTRDNNGATRDCYVLTWDSNGATRDCYVLTRDSKMGRQGTVMFWQETVIGQRRTVMCWQGTVMGRQGSTVMCEFVRVWISRGHSVSIDGTHIV